MASYHTGQPGTLESGMLSKRHIGACSFELRTEFEQMYMEA